MVEYSISMKLSQSVSQSVPDFSHVLAEEGAAGGDKASETANIAQSNVEQLKNECEQLKKVLESWNVKYNELEKELNALRTHCRNLEKDLADLEGWKYECTELQLKVK